MSTFLAISEIPRDRDGAIVGLYHVRDRSSGTFAEEVGGRAIGGPELARVEAALGSYATIEPADYDTAQACARHIFETTRDGARAKALRAMFRKAREPRPKRKNALRKLSEGA